MPAELEKWLHRCRYLPPFMRDFHDQKKLFRAMHEIVRKPEPNALVRRPDWIEGQVYVIDVFLWFMARRGYTLQKTRAKLPFRDIEKDVEAVTSEREQRALALLKEATDRH